MNMEDNFKGIAIGDLISAPLLACCEAQIKISRDTLSFVKSLINEDGTPQTLDFLINKSVTTEAGKKEQISSKIKAPILGLIPVPSLMVDSFEMEFSMEINSTSSSKNDSESTDNFNRNNGRKYQKTEPEKNNLDNWLAEEKVEMHGTLASSNKETRVTDNSAKYKVKVIAKQQPVPEGMARVLDMMAQGMDSS